VAAPVVAVAVVRPYASFSLHISLSYISLHLSLSVTECVRVRANSLAGSWTTCRPTSPTLVYSSSALRTQATSPASSYYAPSLPTPSRPPSARRSRFPLPLTLSDAHCIAADARDGRRRRERHMDRSARETPIRYLSLSLSVCLLVLLSLPYFLYVVVPVSMSLSESARPVFPHSGLPHVGLTRPCRRPRLGPADPRGSSVRAGRVPHRLGLPLLCLVPPVPQAGTLTLSPLFSFFFVLLTADRYRRCRR
jgi:hypothetical protein